MVKSNAALQVVEPTIDRELLTKIAHGTVKFVSKSEGETVGLLHNPPLIEVNMGQHDPHDANKVMCRITPAGANFLTSNSKENIVSSNFEIISNAELPPVKRSGGGAGAPQKYPFDNLEVGQSFFVPVSAKVPNPLKSLGSTIAVANLRFAVDTGETKIVERSKRGAKNRLLLDDEGNKIMETKVVPVLEFTRKFTIRGIEAGKQYGGWLAKENGALIMRVK